MRAIGVIAAVLVTGAAWAEKPVVEAAKTVAAAASPERVTPRRIAAQQEAMRKLAFLDGEWRGPSKKKSGDAWVAMTQTLRVGAVLDGTVRVIEGRGYDADGTLSFNALRILSFDPDTKTYKIRAYQGGSVRDHAVELTEGGIAWEIEARGAKVRYEAGVKNGVWTETATRMSKAGEPEVYLSFAAKRLRGSAWPAEGAVAAR